MKLILLLFLLCLLINNSKCGPDIFKFTSEPVSQNVNPGGSVTLSCVATGRSGITYSWYKLDNVNFNTPPTNSDLISGETNTEYVVQAADVDESGEDRLFQCKATAGSDVILSKVSTVLYKLPDSIEYDNTGKIYINAPIFTSSSDSDKEVFLFSLPCNTLETDYDTSITNGEPYDVQWFKDDETDRVEDSHSNMWTYYTELKSTILYDAVVDANFPVSRSNIKKYDLFIFNVQKSDTGTYSCKAVSRKNKQNVLLGSTVLTVPAQNNQYTIRPKAIAAGFMVLAVDSTGKIRSRPKEGDEVLLMCGVACRTSSGSWDPQYQWKDSSGAVIASTREHIVTVGSAGTVSYTCEILNSECASKLSSAQKTVNMNVGAADLDPLLPFTFSKSPPEYMWYVSDSSKSHDPFEIGCEGSYTSGNTDVVFHNSVLRVPNIVASSGDDVVYDFNSSFTSDKSGVYQCVMFNTPDKVVLYQQTANVIIAENPTSIITPASMNVLDGTTATFTCTVGGYPIESVSISVPDSASVVTCPQTSGNVTCSSTDNTNYEVEVKNMVLSKSGQYTCTVQTKWYKTDGTVMGKQVSASITVTYVKASTTVLTASSTTVKLGEPVTLTCVVEGYPEPATPTLTKYGSQIDWSSACTGTNRKECLKEFSSTKFSDSGEYVCAGSNTIDGTENKSEDKLDLTIEGDVAVTLTQTPAGSEQNKGSSVTLTCKAEGNPLPTKLTFKKGEQVLKSYTGGDDSSIKKGTYHILYEHTISSLVLADTATYKCEGQNTVNGVVKDSSAPPLDLVVISAVEVNLTSTNDTPAKDESITITCTARGGRKPHSVELKKDSTIIKSYPTDSGFCTETDSFTLECTFVTSAGYASGGTYDCIGKNTIANSQVKTVSKSIDIAVSESVKVTMTPASPIEVPIGTDTTVTCTVEGGKKPHKVTLTKPDASVITWLSDGAGSTELSCSGDHVKTCLYKITTVAYSDEGNYQCDGYNTLPGQSSEQKDTAQVSLVPVKDVSVTITKGQVSSFNEVSHGDPFTIGCQADGGRIPFYLKFEHIPTTGQASEIVLYNNPSTTPAEVIVSESENTLSYDYSVSSADYNHDGTYNCLSKNRAASNVEKSDSGSQAITVVKNVTSVITLPDIVDKGSQLKITCSADGNRPPHYVALEKDGVLIKNWMDPATSCKSSTLYNITCGYDVADIGYSDGGTYGCISKNKALEQKIVSSKDTKTVEISQSVLTSFSPNSTTELLWGSDSLNLLCSIEGGLPPHKVNFEIPNGTTYNWTRQSSGTMSNSLTCNGDHELRCEHQVISTTFDHSGLYKCIGYNKLPNSSVDDKMEKTVEVVVVKDVKALLTSSSDTDEVSFGAALNLTCNVKGGRAPFYIRVQFTDQDGGISNLIEYNSYNKPDNIKEEKNSLEYVHVINGVGYNDSGVYNCSGKNRAYENEEKADEMSKEVVVVKDVEIDPIEDIEADYGTSFTFTITLNGGRSPHLVKLENTGSQIFKWQKDSDVCSGTNVLTCTKVVGNSDVNFGYDGNYTVTAQNTAKDKTVHTDKKIFKVTVYKDVSAAINPSSDSTMTYHVDKTITCYVMGGLAPHKIDLILPNQVTKTWTEDGNGNSLTCTGTHEKTCTYTFAPEYNSDGHYKCVGYNKVRASEEKQKESTVIQLTTVRSTEVTISNKTLSVLTNGTVDVHCTIVGKPLVDSSAVSWSHEKLTDLNLSGNVSTVKGSKDDYTLVSTLSIVNPLTEYSGSFNCNVQAGDDQVITKSVVVSINNREFLDAPKVTHNGGEAVEQDTVMSITCLVKGFPRPSATLIYKNLVDGEQSREISGASKIDPISPTSTEFEFQLSTSCEYSQYNFICEAKNTNNTDSGVLKESSSVEGPIVTGCENTLPVMIGGGVGGGVALIAIVVIAVLCILKRVKSNRNKEYSPKNGTQIPNPAFGADPSYATVRETPGAIGYSHLNRPVGETTEDGYASIDQMNRQTGPGLVPAADAYATLDTASNGRMGLKRQGSDAAYAALNRPAPGKEKRGVIRKYKPIASKPKSTFVPNKAADIELGEVNNGDQPEPTYATVNPATMKAKKTTSEYADVEIPDLPPEVPIYGQGVINKAAPSEYADVTIPPSEYADVTLPPPPPLPDGPVYSNMSETQGAVTDGDPVYAQVDMKSRNAKKNPADEEEEEDLPPDVPIYGTMGARTESNYPDEDEDPYATVEFVPKSKRKPPRPISKEDTSEGLYATITDFKENSEG